MAEIDTALVLRMEASLSKLEKQMRQGQAVVDRSTRGMQASMDRAGKNISASALRGAAGIQRVMNISGRGRFVLQNTANQLGDIAVQMQMGTAASRVMSQQLPQLLGGFGALGGSLGLVAPLLGTVAAIGIPVAAAMLAMGRDSEEAAFQLEKINGLDLGQARSAIESLAGIQERYTEALRVAAATRSATAIENVAAIGQEYAAQKALFELQAVQTENRLRQVTALREAKEAELRATLEQARAEAEAFTGIDAGDPDGMRRRNEAVARAILDVADSQRQLIGEIKQAKAEQALLEVTTKTVKTALQEADAVQASMNGHIEEGRLSAEGIADAAGSITFEGAATSAAALANQLSLSLDLAKKLAEMGPQGVNLNPDPSGKTYGGRGGDPRQFGGSAYDIKTAEATAFLANWTAPGSGGGGGGGGASQIDQLTQKYEALRGQLEPAYRSLQQLQQAQVTLKAAYDAGMISLEEYNRLLGEAQVKYGQSADAAVDYANVLGNTLGNILVDIYGQIRDGASAWDALKNAALNALDAIAQEALKLAAMQIVKAIFGGGFADGGIFASGGLVASAKGNVFAGGRVVPFANGGVVSGPTLFPMRGGATGLMGEAGPEAIMPLTRGPGGRLGVEASGGGAVRVEVNLYGDIEGSPVRQQNGRIDIDLGRAINAAIAGGAADKAMGQRYKIMPKG